LKRNLLTVRTLLLLIAGTLLVVGGIVNFYQRLTIEPPLTDGINWDQTAEGPTAKSIDPRATRGRFGLSGILPGDRLRGISLDGKQFDKIVEPHHVEAYLEEAQRTGTRRLVYLIERPSTAGTPNYYQVDLDDLAPLNNWAPQYIYLIFVGLIYLLVGSFVLFRYGGHTPWVSHFTTICLAGFVSHFYNVVGWYDRFDRTVFLLDFSAYIFFAPLIVHFCARFPIHNPLSLARRLLCALLYSPAILLIIATMLLTYVWLQIRVIPPQWMVQVALREVEASERLINILYIVNSLYFRLMIGCGVIVLICRFLWTSNPIVRQWLKWVFWGSVIGITPSLLLFAVDYVFGDWGAFSMIVNTRIYPWLINAGLLPLVLVPISIGYSIMRYEAANVEPPSDASHPKPASVPQLNNLRDPYRIVGATLSQRYKLCRYAGSGGMGAVYQAVDSANGDLVAVKVLKPDLVAKTPEYIQLFSKEVEAAKQLKHQNIVQVLDNGIDGELAYMVMEWLEGKSVEDIVAEEQLTLARIIVIFEQICSAVACAHDHSIIHLDLKPANILFVQKERSRDFVKVIDFGLARVISKESGTTVTRFRGTHQYCAPEQFGGRVSKRSDIYSLGATLYYLISGVIPFGATYINAKLHKNLELPEIPSPTRQRGFHKRVDQVIMKALSKDPDARQQTVRQLFEEFQEATLSDGVEDERVMTRSSMDQIS
jgi:hypothetical protein